MSSYKALWIEACDDGFQTTIQERQLSELHPADSDNILIKVHYSSLNFKDALSSSGNKGVTKSFPHQPGIDAAGVIAQSSDPNLPEGSEVIVTGYDLGMNTAGGLAEYISVPAAWIIKKPEGLSLRQAMQFGTAGLTAGLCIKKLELNNIDKQGEILVTGATGGVGSIATFLLAEKGYQVSASSGKADKADFLKSIGASTVIDRNELSEANPRPLLKERFSAVLDVVGGNTLSNALKQIKAGGSAAICGLVESHQFDTTVMPFILRGVNLLGVDSVEIPLTEKAAVWQDFAQLQNLSALESINSEISLEDVAKTLKAILNGQGEGHYLVKI